MPRSKRAKVVHLTRVAKKDKEDKQKFFAAIRAAADLYTSIFVFSVADMRNTYLKDVRSHFSDSRLFFGKTKVMAKALGKTAEEEYVEGLSQLSQYLEGSVGLLFTKREPSEVLEYFENLSEPDFARAGTAANRDFTIPAGMVYSRGGEVAVEDDVLLPHSLEVTLRKWGMSTRLDKGKIMLDHDHLVCKDGQILDSKQTAICKLFGVAMAEFRVQVRAYWTAESHDVTPVAAEGAMEED